MSGRFPRLLAGLVLAAATGSAVAGCNPLVRVDPVGPQRGGPAPVTSTTPAPVSKASAYESRILALVNAERAKQGEHPLTLVNCAETFADSWAATMARTGNFAHQKLNPIMQACDARGAGENIAYGNVSADAMMTMWMNSPGHRANILNASYTGIGIGAVKTSSGRWYGVQDFVTQ